MAVPSEERKRSVRPDQGFERREDGLASSAAGDDFERRVGLPVIRHCVGAEVDGGDVGGFGSDRGWRVCYWWEVAEEGVRWGSRHI